MFQCELLFKDKKYIPIAGEKKGKKVKNLLVGPKPTKETFLQFGNFWPLPINIHIHIHLVILWFYKYGENIGIGHIFKKSGNPLILVSLETRLEATMVLTLATTP